ncbi:hypothetical protein RKE29_06735 [Streptomyces sp. B1866]|uniref:hypothetical protein n=1 Tax=Streptomyces sp. B1866 TaxID=3075431 RepID=UPI00288E5AFC|nr:hypothetical protein [Streptomyces sp. B1866]MDT3396338.1 hypothetical protein [Streptomyces sp. B1866]
MRAQESTREARSPGQVEIFSRDLPPEVYGMLAASGRVAWDIETNGLEPQDAQIGTCQLHSPGVGAFIITGLAGEEPPMLTRLLSNERVQKVFHHAPFDLSFMAHAWKAEPRNVACTKIAAKLLAPSAPAEEHSLKYLMQHHFNVRLNKRLRFTDWMSDTLSPHQIEYAVGDVMKLLDLYDLLKSAMDAEGLIDLYEKCLHFLPTHVTLRLHGCPDPFKY